MALFSFSSGKTLSAHKEHLIAFRGGLQMASAISGFSPDLVASPEKKRRGWQKSMKNACRRSRFAIQSLDNP
jgi:hypothetical protein